MKGLREKAKRTRTRHGWEGVVAVRSATASGTATLKEAEIATAAMGAVDETVTTRGVNEKTATEGATEKASAGAAVATTAAVVDFDGSFRRSCRRVPRKSRPHSRNPCTSRPHTRNPRTGCPHIRSSYP